MILRSKSRVQAAFTEHAFKRNSIYSQDTILPGLKIHCEKCREDVKDHMLYHLNLHGKCKICRLMRIRGTGLINNEKLACHHCYKSCITKRALEKHMRLHDLDTFQSCTKCGKLYKNHNTFREHMDKYHGADEEKLFPCEKCNKSFSSETNLNVHIKYIHNVQARLDCVECEESFKHRNSLVRHLKNIHKIDLNYHTVDANAAIVKYKCDKCDKEYSYKGDLNQHKKLHTDITIQCKICSPPKTFKFNTNLQRHLRKKHVVNFDPIDSSQDQE